QEPERVPHLIRIILEQLDQLKRRLRRRPVGMLQLTPLSTFKNIPRLTHRVIIPPPSSAKKPPQPPRPQRPPQTSPTHAQRSPPQPTTTPHKTTASHNAWGPKSVGAAGLPTQRGAPPCVGSEARGNGPAPHTTRRAPLRGQQNPSERPGSPHNTGLALAWGTQ